MSNEYIDAIDAHLHELLPKDPTAIQPTLAQEQKTDMIQLLQYAAQTLGKSPTAAEFDALDLTVSADAIRNAFGTWNAAKTEADLETFHPGPSTPIRKDYFETIDSTEKAYWLGTLFAHSSLNYTGNSTNRSLQIARVTSKSHFVRGFAAAVESAYAINTYSHPDPSKPQDTVQLQISNPTFITHLTATGYPDAGSDPNIFPTLEDTYQPAFTRGYLESAGGFSSNGWRVTVATRDRAEWLHTAFQSFGAKRPTISKNTETKPKVNVSNVFDITSVFETCWPDQLNTTPSWTPYPEKILTHLKTNHPYPDTIPCLSNQHN